MQRNSIFFIIFPLSFILIACSISAGGSRGMAPYKKETFATIKGEVKSIDTVFNRVTQEHGLHLTVKTSSEEYIVHVCPQWYADKKQLTFEKAELLTISGSTFIKDNQPNIYAATITRNSSNSLKLRNPDTGDGLWSGRYKNEKRFKKHRKNPEKMRKNMP